VILEKERIVIKKIDVNKHKTTSERLREFYGTEFNKKNIPQKEVDWGHPVGKEV
jgi:hypothetical protein